MVNTKSPDTCLSKRILSALEACLPPTTAELPNELRKLACRDLVKYAAAQFTVDPTISQSFVKTLFKVQKSSAYPKVGNLAVIRAE